MGLRLKYEGNNAAAQEFEFHIYDEDYSGPVIPFNSDLAEAYIKINGAAKDPFKLIKTGEFGFTMYVENSDHLDFYNALRGQQEDRFFVHAYLKDKNEGSGVFEHIFIGYLVIDEVWLSNGDNRKIEIRAADGLNKLTEQEFKISEDETPATDIYGEETFYFQGRATIAEILIECLKGTGTQDQYPAASFGNNYLVVNHHWFESEHPNQFVSPFDNIRINHLIFTKRDDEGNYLTTTKADVLEDILTTFGCTITYQWGSYFIENVSEQGKDSKSVFEYDKTGTFLYKTLQSDRFHTVTHPFTDPTLPYPTQGGKFGHLPPLKDVNLTFSYELSSWGYIPNFWSDTEDTLVNLGQLKVTSELTSLFIAWGFEFIYTSALPDPPPSDYIDSSLMFWWAITIKWGTWYYVTTTEVITIDEEDSDGNSIQYEITNHVNEWTETAGTYLLRSNPLVKGKAGQIVLETNEVTMPPFASVDGIDVDDVDDLSIKVEFVKITTPDQQTEITDIDVTWKTAGFYATIVEDGERVDGQAIGIKYTGTNNDKNRWSIGLNTRVGDGPFNSNNGLEIFNGTDWVPSSRQWGVKTTSGTQGLHELLINEIVSKFAASTQRYQGSFRMMGDMRYNFKYDGSTWLPIGDFKYSFLWAEWTGEFVEDTTAPQTLTIVANGVQADSNGTLSTATAGNSNENPADAATQEIYSFKFEGDGTKEIDFGDIPLPDPTNLTKGQIEYLCHFYRNDLRAWYNEETIQGFTIDYADNKVDLWRRLPAGEFLRGYLIKLS